jgi:hypothetical protein
MNRPAAGAVDGGVAEEAVPVPGVSGGTRSRIVVIGIVLAVLAVLLVVALLAGGGGGGGGVDPGGGY